MAVEGTTDNMLNDEQPSEEFNKAFDEIAASELDQEEPQGEELEQQEETTEEQDEKKEEIPDSWVVAGREAGLSDDEIVALADSTPKALEALVNRKVVQPQPQPQETIETQIEDKSLKHVEFTIPQTVDGDTRKLFEQVMSVNNQLVDRLNEAQSKLDNFEDRSRQHEQAIVAAEDKAIDDFFDSQVENLPALGTNETLTDAQLAVRKEVYQLANVISGSSREDRLEKAIRAYNGIHGEAEKNLARKLYKNKTRFSPRPQGRKTNMQFKSDDERAMHVLEEKLREYGA